MRKLLAASLLTLTLSASVFAGIIPYPGGPSPSGSTSSETAQPEEDTETSISDWLYALIFGA